MSRPEVEVQKKNYTDLLDRQKLITEDNHSSANKKKSNTRHNLFCTTCLENKIFFPYLCIRIYLAQFENLGELVKNTIFVA